MTDASSTKRGDALEQRVYEFFSEEIAADRFYAKPNCCKIQRKPKYFSRDRGSEITFDVSIELYMPGSTDFFSVVLIECKNYGHAVPVDDAEEFFAKVQQVAASKAKGVIASTASFQSGAREFARSKGIGLLRYFSRTDCKWELMRSPSCGIGVNSPEDSSDATAGLSDQEHRSKVFDLYLQSPMRDTHSLWRFLEDILLDAELTPTQLRKIVSSRSKDKDSAPFIEKDAIENLAGTVLEKLGYVSGVVPLDRLCETERVTSGLSVQLDVVPSAECIENRVLGRISFDTLRIEVYRQPNPNNGRMRFTLAHELSHYLLEHGKYMRHEYCDAGDFTLERRSTINGTNVTRMEFQANYLAASILLPRHNVLTEFMDLASRLELPNRGFGSLLGLTQKNKINLIL